MTTRRTPIILARGRRGVAGATGAQGAGADSVGLRVGVFENKAHGTNVYVDAVNGNDGNDGASTSSPVQSLTVALNLLKCGSYNTVHLLTDVDMDLLFVWTSPPRSIKFLGSGGRRKVRVLNATNGTGLGSVRLFGGATIYIDDVDFELASDRGWGMFDLREGHYNVYYRDSVLTRTGTGDARLFYPVVGASMLLEAVNYNVSAAAGYFIQGVASGSNPNTRFNITSNITVV